VGYTLQTTLISIFLLFSFSSLFAKESNSNEIELKLESETELALEQDSSQVINQYFDSTNLKEQNSIINSEFDGSLSFYRNSFKTEDYFSFILDKDRYSLLQKAEYTLDYNYEVRSRRQHLLLGGELLFPVKPKSSFSIGFEWLPSVYTNQKLDDETSPDYGVGSISGGCVFLGEIVQCLGELMVELLLTLGIGM
jgi:hypothetical protein